MCGLERKEEGEKAFVCVCRPTVSDKKAERQDERSIKAISEILKAVVGKSAGKP